MSAAVELRSSPEVVTLLVPRMRPELIEVIHVLHVKRIASVATISTELGYARTWAYPFVIALELSDFVLELYPSVSSNTPSKKRAALYCLTERGVQASKLTDRFVRKAIADWRAYERNQHEVRRSIPEMMQLQKLVEDLVLGDGGNDE